MYGSAFGVLYVNSPSGNLSIGRLEAGHLVLADFTAYVSHAAAGGPGHAIDRYPRFGRSSQDKPSMKGNALRKVLAKLELSQVDAAKFIGIASRSVRRWVADDAEIPDAAAMLFGIMAKYEITPAEARSLIGLPWPDQKPLKRNMVVDLLTAVMMKHNISHDVARKFAA
jgi:hypothetical protein